jgi:hypothetical protein
MAGFELTTYGRFYGDHRGPGRSVAPAPGSRFGFHDRLLNRLPGGMSPKIVVRGRRVLSMRDLNVIVLALHRPWFGEDQDAAHMGNAYASRPLYWQHAADA